MSAITSKALHDGAWSALLGEWEVSSPLFPDATGLAVFEWIEGGAYLALRTAPPQPAPSSVWLIGADDGAETCTALYSDSRGISRVYGTSFLGDTWTIWRGGDPFSQRFEAQVDLRAGTIRGTWFISENGKTWRPDFDLVYRRLDERA